ncbi:MAG: NAD(P)/FAD-dependent oxidoreductase [Mycobacteriales bacterium]
MAGRERIIEVATRKALSGAVAGLVAGALVSALMQFQGMFGDNGSAAASWAVLLGSATAIGGVIGVITDHRSHELAAAVSGGALVGLLGWIVIALTLNPMLHGTPPTWTVAAAATVYRTLIGAVLHGALTGGALHGLWSVRRPRSGSGAAPVAPLTRVVIVGGGFAGVSAAQRFERLVLRGVSIDVTVISDSNFLLFTPMLAEVASSALEPAHISAPVRSAVAHTRFRHGAVDDIDTTGRAVLMSGDRVPYDHLVIAVGSVPSFLDLPGVEENSFTMKDLADATRLRDHVIALLERCDQLTDPKERERLLTFVVAGGGFAGAETVAELFDLVHGVLHLYPGITADEPRFVLVHSRDRILPELSPQLGAYALERLRARGIGFRLGIRVSEASSDAVVLSDGARISTATFVWTAGTRPSPFVARIAGEHARNGALVTDATFRVTGLDRVWAVGDCARIPDLDQGGAPFPPTAQHALRQGRALADNIAAVISGRPPVAFRFRTIGVLVALGHRTAAAEIRGHRFSGLAAWLLWRGIYLAKLPGTEKRVRVLLDWLLDLVFPRDVVVTTKSRAGASTVPEPSTNGGHR